MHERQFADSAESEIYHGVSRKLSKQKTANPSDNCALKVAIRAMISLGESQHGQARRVCERPAFLDIQQ
ncbi:MULTISPECIES: hypothetical protein [Janthinobacterium]|uniref:Uncharacterized protein n=1 Tax=Janthinobacterium aestuarii TaxID=2985511 RepID=A0ABZ2GFS1_9BURK|nr:MULTISPECIES: hypothetical protein [Janthinobacterium]MBW3500805.1 hypothetical protein [Janthinobacterium sp. NKUCC08_JDC]